MKRILVALILRIVWAGTTVSNNANAEQLQVTVYNKANLPVNAIKRAIANLSLILRQADIEVRWVIGERNAAEATQVIYDSAVNKEQEHRLVCSARRGIAIDILAEAPSSVPQSVLGMALPFASAGINVRVFRDHVTAAALARGVEEPDILGHVIAHEIGHVLIRSSAHTANGLMAGVWRAHEYYWIATGSMFFTPVESNMMRRSMSGSSCPPAILALR